LVESEAHIYSEDNTVPKGGAIEQYMADFNKAAGFAGLQNVAPKLEGYLRDAGFVDVKASVKKMPLGAWAKDPMKKVRPHFTRYRASSIYI
jgi:phage terminase large subunit